MDGSDVRPTLAEAVSWLSRCEALPHDVETKARLLLLDTFGCLVAGLGHPEVRRFGQALRFAFPGDTTWPGSDIKLGLSGMAALGAAAACWDEACEGHAPSHGRPGLPVVPALLALAASHEITLSDLLLALATGYEIGARAGEAWRIPAGWHVDGSWHSLGVAAAVARMTGGPARIGPAIEAAACQIPASLYLPITAGSVLRNTYPAHAVLLGIMAAAAANADFAMPHGALEEARRRVLQAPSTAAVTLAGRWTILDGYLKLYAAVRHTHYGIEAALRLRRRPNFSVRKINAIKLDVYPEAVQYCGNRAPRTAIQAQFSLSYAIAAALVIGDLGPEAYADVGSPTITRLESLVTVEANPMRIQRSAQLSIDLDGTIITESIDDIPGDASNPTRMDQVVAKFRRYTEPALGQQRAKALMSFILHGDSTKPARRCLLDG
ncbi:MmgE/PrpD family protein [Rhodoplanes sp. Z2-YC6860]|uniref:MmgE/PrpD family protein n=1 Tax=Rhodoplanes sp. Z2-YC6860 TaxID=674703 RepID=UPI00078DC234|nr:MmgE/PrpD family protein [Rhodoplanes sp. Z2-YC6860]AMN39385.1 MmgE/PrpD family protein [Rhodoplanes sp. Z2-YC6860]